jgi:MYXO-CTERM domain-containing protein
MRILHKIALAGLVALTASVLSAGSITFNVTTTIPLEDVNAVFIDCGVPIGSCNGGSFEALIIDDPEGSYPVETNHPDVFNGISTGGFESGYFTYLALSQASPSDVVVALESGVPITGESWPFSTPESTVAGWLATGDTTDLTNFFLANLTDFPQINGTTGNLAEFSTGVVVGSVSGSVSPEPAAGGLMALGLLTLVVLHRRRKVSLRKIDG